MDSTTRANRRFSTMERPPTTGRRGVTPSKTPFEAKQGEQAPKPKPVLSTAQQLEIIERLESGRYQRGVGLSQFYEEFEKAPTSSKGCTKNLMKDFKNTSVGSTDLGDPLFSSTAVSDDQDLVDEVQDSVRRMHTDLDEIEDYSSLPWYIKQMDKLIVYYDMYRKQIMNMADTRVDEEFFKYCPPDELMATLSKIGRYTALLEKYNSKSTMDKMRLFEPPNQSSKKSTKPVIHCNVDMQNRFIAALHKIKDLMEVLDNVTIPGADKDWSKEFDNLKIILENIDERLQTMDALQNVSKDIFVKAEVVELTSQFVDGSSTESSPNSSNYSI